MEHKYSPIKKVLVTNYRNIERAIFSFEKSPIISLVGENDSGKSSAIMGFITCALNANATKHKKHIRHGTKFFGVAIELWDGTIIKRLKSSTANRYEIIYPDNTVWSTSKLSEGLPVQVQELIGMIQEPETKEYLHVRTYRDKMLFVDTPDSTNYKVVYEALKVGQITRAVKKGTEESNDLYYEISQNRTKLVGLCESEKNIIINDLGSLVSMKDAVKRGIKALEKIDEIRSLISENNKIKEELGTLRLINTFKLEPISEARCIKLNDTYNNYNECIELNNKINAIKQVDAVESIDTTTIRSIEDILLLKKEVKNAQKECKEIEEVNSLSDINIGLISSMERTIELINELKGQKAENEIYSSLLNVSSIENEVNTLENISEVINILSNNANMRNELYSIDNYVKQSNEYLKSIGVAFEKCPNCGEQVMIDYSKM